MQTEAIFILAFIGNLLKETYDRDSAIGAIWVMTSKGTGSFHIHHKTMKDLWALAVLGVREQPNMAHNLVTHRH